IIQAQIRVSGIVSDQNNDPLIGVTVKVIDTNVGTITDLNGKYTIAVPAGKNSLEFSYTGFTTLRMPVNNQAYINVTLKESIKQLEEVMVIGYGAMKKRDITGAISSISAQTIEEKTPISIYDALQGQSSGVQIVTGSGAPGEG